MTDTSLPSAAIRVVVPCNGCTICCRGDGEWLVELQKGDNPKLYPGNVVTTEEGRSFMALNPDGSCVNLTAAGCSVYDTQPLACQEFSCKTYAQLMAPVVNPRAYDIRVMAQGNALISAAAAPAIAAPSANDS